MLTSTLWNKLYEEFNDASRWSFEHTPVYNDPEDEQTYTNQRIFNITWKPSAVCFDFLYSKYKNTGVRRRDGSIQGEWGHILKLVLRNYSTANQYKISPIKDKSWSHKNRYGYVWRQSCSFDTENKTLKLYAKVEDDLLSYRKVHQENPNVLTSQRIKIVLTVPICHNDPEFPFIKASSDSWKNRSKEHHGDGETPAQHAASGGGPIKFSTHLWCKVALDRIYPYSPRIYDFKSAYDYNYGRTYTDPETGIEGVNCHHRYYTKWVTRDYRIAHNRAHWKQKIKK